MALPLPIKPKGLFNWISLTLPSPPFFFSSSPQPSQANTSPIKRVKKKISTEIIALLRSQLFYFCLI
uniref:Uncharacterized protein n=1 Tax=Phlebia radiata TaxID=5308 RepID=L8B9I4_PHLRA|nr:hypothetical protein Pra_mt0312 [Phlebia radiata]CCF07380.1 hypothetical protein Pra_mt0312 [Phlebia radiata]